MLFSKQRIMHNVGLSFVCWYEWLEKQELNGVSLHFVNVTLDATHIFTHHLHQEAMSWFKHIEPARDRIHMTSVDIYNAHI